MVAGGENLGPIRSQRGPHTGSSTWLGALNLSKGRDATTNGLVLGRTRYILPPPPANNFSTSATITSAPARSMLPTRCQRITPC